MAVRIYHDDRDDTVYLIWGGRGAYLQIDSDGRTHERMYLPPTAADLNPPEDVWSEAFSCGSGEGYDRGYDEGYRNGYRDGKEDEGEDW